MNLLNQLNHHILKKIGLAFLLTSMVSIMNPASAHATFDYEITRFNSQITINQDTSITVTERIVVNFLTPKHGLIRVIPVVYSARPLEDW